VTASNGFDAGAEFDRQVATLHALGYPKLTGLGDDEFGRLVAPLRPAAVARAGRLQPPTASHAPFVLVVGKDLAPVEETVGFLALPGRTEPGFLDRHYAPGEIRAFESLKELQIPAGGAYLLIDVDRGEDLRNLAPDEALARITGRGRTPLTVDEGIALVTHVPATLEKNKCFSLPGSRAGDRRVPALWISGRAPKLGWCWAGNPHTWLGSASCADRAVLP
jgi:hypothetical protein